MRRPAIGALLLATLCGRATLAGDIHVNNVLGDDRYNGRTPEIRSQLDGPVATIARALEIALGTDGLVIANTGEPYHESLMLDRPALSGTEVYPFIIEGNGATLRGARPLPREVWRRAGEGTYRFQPFRKGHYQLVVNGKIAQEVRAEPGADVPPALEPLEWCAHRGFVYFHIEPFTGAPNEQFKYITDYQFEVPALEVGVGLHNARNVIVRNLNLELFRLDGVAVTGNSRNVRLLNVRCTSNGRAGLSVAGASQVEVGGLELSGNRIAGRLVLMKGRVIDLPDTAVPPRPAPITWDLDSGRYVRIVPPNSERSLSTANAGSVEKK